MTKKTSMDTSFHTQLPWLKEGNIVSVPIIKMYGAKTIGKDEITTALKKESCNGEKVRNLGVWRGLRQGEEFPNIPGIDPAMLQDIVEKKVLAFYPSSGILYVVLEENVTRIIDTGKTPVLHIGSRYGVPTIEQSGKFPHSLNILLTMDRTRTDFNDDLRTRAIWRLAKYSSNPDSTWTYGPDWNYKNGNLEDKTKVDKQVQKTRDNITWLEEEGSKIISYHAIFNNNKPSDDDMRCYVRERVRDKDVVTHDIARRINELFRRFKEKLDNGVSYTEIDFPAIHREYTDDCLAAVFGQDQKVKKNTSLAYNQLVQAVHAHADGYGLTEVGLSGIVRNVRVASFEQSQAVKGRRDILLISTDERPIFITDVQAEHFYSKFHILGVIAEAVFQQTHTLPQYQVENGVVKGLTFSLTDRSVGNKRSQLFIGYN